MLASAPTRLSIGVRKAGLTLAGFVLSASAPAWGAEAALCRLGKRQSPIDIRAATPGRLPQLEFAYQSEPLRVANDGHTLRVRMSRGGYLKLGAELYRLQQFHFHTPGGDRLSGEEFPLAAHLLHKGASGQLLAVVVLFRLGAPHPGLSSLWAHIPAAVDGDHAVPGQVANAQAMLPVNKGYFRYTGSLTASPCTEGVTWLVMKQPLEVSAEQLQLWKKHFADNIRSTQPMHGREVLASD